MGHSSARSRVEGTPTVLVLSDAEHLRHAVVRGLLSTLVMLAAVGGLTLAHPGWLPVVVGAVAATIGVVTVAAASRALADRH